MDGAISLYYFVTNLQGDVVRITNAQKETLANYSYDAYGKLLSVTNAAGAAISDTSNIALINPLRYRGYYYDSETELYYLQSRYYDPTTSRFINADSYVSTGQDFLGFNMFAYCGNNPVMHADANGHYWQAIVIAAVVAGVIGAVTTAIFGGTWKDIALAFVRGCIEGALSKALPTASIIIAGIHAVESVYECRDAGASWGKSLLAGALSFLSSLISCGSGDKLTDALFELVFGMGSSLTSDAVKKGITDKASKNLPLNNPYAAGGSTYGYSSEGRNRRQFTMCEI